MSTTKTLDQLSINTSLSTTDLFLVQKEGIDQQTTFNTIQEAIAIETLERVPAIKVTNATFADQASAVAWSAISGKPTTWAWAAITGTPSTLTGYGITDALRNNANSTLVGNLGITGILSVSSSSNVGASITTNGISVETANVGVTNTNIGVYGYARSGTSANYGLKARADGHVAASAYGIFAYASANGVGNSVNSYGIYAQAEQVAVGSGVCWGGYFQGKDGIRVCDAVTTHDGVVLLGRAGGSTSYNAILTPATLSANRTLTLPNLTGTLTTLENAQIWTNSQTFRGSNAVKVEAASTQDAIVLAGRAGGTDSFAVSITPAVLSANRTLTLPNVSGTIATLENVQTWTAAQLFRGTNAVRVENAATQDGVILAGRDGGSHSYAITLIPMALSDNRILTLPDATGTLATTGNSSQVWAAIQTFRGTNAVRVENDATQDAIVLAGRAGGTDSFAATLTSEALTGNRTLTLPNVSGTIATLENAQVWSNSQTFRGANYLKVEVAATNDAIILTGRAGGTGSYAITLTSAALSTNRTITLPDLDGTVAVLESGKITATQFESTATGATAPFIVASTTKVTNLNADQIDGIEASAFVQTTGNQSIAGVKSFTDQVNCAVSSVSLANKSTNSDAGITFTVSKPMSVELTSSDGRQTATLKIKNHSSSYVTLMSTTTSVVGILAPGDYQLLISINGYTATLYALGAYGSTNAIDIWST